MITLTSGTTNWKALCEPLLDVLELPVFLLDAAGVAVCANPCWTSSYGDPGHEPWAMLNAVVEEDRERVRRTLEYALASNRGTEIEFQVELVDGRHAVLDCSASYVHGDNIAGAALVCVCWDVTEKRRNEERLAFMAGHDPLTGLLNRRAFEEALARAVSRAERGGKATLLLLDLDRLKDYNDARGHLDGDQALVNLAMLLRSHTRSGDLPARVGGDEFAVLLEDADISEAEEIADRIRAAAASAEFVPGARQFNLGVSGGIAFVEPGVDSRSLMDRVDAALYAAKSSGRGTIVRWSPEMETAGERERLGPRVRAAFSEGGFYLLYQPVMRLDDYGVAYYESLARMKSDGPHGQLPVEFLPVVERLGLMPRLTKRIVELAMQELATAPKSSVSVNLSASDLGDADLLDEVVDIISKMPEGRRHLLFEVSESTLLANLHGGRAWMERLAEYGCSFVLDDFGTGMGMFVLLREPHISQVKLSQTVMRSLSEQASNREFVGALRELIESQGKVAVAGYIETDELLRDVRAAGFSWGQGFRLHEPVTRLNGSKVRREEPA